VSRYDDAARLCRRALRYLESARLNMDRGFYDVSATNCEIAAELLLKSTILFLGANYPQTHNLRDLLSVIDSLMPELGVKDFVRRFRKELKDVESDRIEGQYGSFEVDDETARDCLEFVKNELLPLAKRAWKEKWCEAE
jgi:HEPN domain-containing protein